MDETLKVLNDSLSRIKWRLRSSAKLRLEIDILALCTGMRPAIMVDYGGKLPELQERLCLLLKSCQKESPIFEHLRVMIIEDMIYLIHVKGLAEHASSSLNSKELNFVDLEQDPPKMVSQLEESSIGMQITSIQKFFSLFFPLNEINKEVVSCNRTDHMADAIPCDVPTSSQSSEVLDLSSCMHETQVTVPTLNGWLLGYPVVYLFSKDHIPDAIYNLSTQALRIFRIMVCRNGLSHKGSPPEELTSFSVPYDISMAGSNEPWAQMFLAQMQSRREKCKQTWRTLEMEVSECLPQAIAL